MTNKYKKLKKIVFNLFSISIISSYLSAPVIAIDNNASYIKKELQTDDIVNIEVLKEEETIKEHDNNIIDLKIGTVIYNTDVSNIKFISEGETVPIVDEFEKHYEVVYDNDIYYVPKENLIITEKETYNEDNILLSKKFLDNRGYLVDNIKLNINGKIKEVLKGQPIIVKGLSNGKFKVELDNMFFSISKDLIVFDFAEIDSINTAAISLYEKDNKLNEETYSKNEFLRKTNDEEQIKGLTKIQEEIISNSLNLIGTPYLWGSNDVELGLDGPGFIQSIYQESDITLPFDLKDQAEIGTKVKEGDQLKIGDILYFGDNKIDHAGIYIGGEQFIHSSSGSGGVIVTNIYDKYVQENLVKIMRILD